MQSESSSASAAPSISDADAPKVSAARPWAIWSGPPAGGGVADTLDGGAITPWRRLAVVATLLVAADWLFFSHPVGVSVVLFLILLATGGIVVVADRPRPRAIAVAAGLLAAALVPVLLMPMTLSVGLAGLAAAHFCLVASGKTGSDLASRCAGVAEMVGQVVWRLPVDAVIGVATAGNRPRRRRKPGAITAWIVPLGFGVTFIFLFRSANPLIQDWIGELNLSGLFENVGPLRLLFWAMTAAVVWPFVAVKVHALRRRPTAAPAVEQHESADAEPDTGADWARQLLGRSAILRSLILFNLIFAVQTALDLLFLWGGAELPAGTSLARYAHRGAYPLVGTALLSAAFVLVAMRKGGEAAESRPIRMLVFLWVGQNVLLVASAMLRLDLYVTVYSLTYLRVAAFVWMLLVAVGLVLIVVRIVTARSNGWLVWANLSAATLTLWLCGFVNVPALIADYNVDHSFEISGEGRRLDVAYLMLDLGPQALPAIDRFLERLPSETREQYAEALSRVRQEFHNDWADWRSWNVRDWQLASYLAGNRLGVPPE